MEPPLNGEGGGRVGLIMDVMGFIKSHKDNFVKNLDVSNFLIYLEEVYEVSEGSGSFRKYCMVKDSFLRVN